MVGIISGVTLVLLFITVGSCFFCSCCFVYKKRRAHLNGLYRMQCSSSTASGLVNMYSPSSTSNHNSLVTTPLDIEWSQHGGSGIGGNGSVVGSGIGQNHNHNPIHHGGLMTLPSALSAHTATVMHGNSNGNGNGNGNIYPSSILPSGFPHNNSQSANHNHNHSNIPPCITIPRYQSQPPTPQQIQQQQMLQQQIQHHQQQQQQIQQQQNINNNNNHHRGSSFSSSTSSSLPPPVFYPQNHLNGNNMNNGNGAPYMLTTSSYCTTPRQRHNYHPNLTLPTISRSTQYAQFPNQYGLTNTNVSAMALANAQQNGNQNRIQGSILRVTTSNSFGGGPNSTQLSQIQNGPSMLPLANSFTNTSTSTASGALRPISEIITTHGQSSYPLSNHAHVNPNPNPNPSGTVVRRNSGGTSVRASSISTSSCASSTGTGTGTGSGNGSGAGSGSQPSQHQHKPDEPPNPGEHVNTCESSRPSTVSTMTMTMTSNHDQQQPQNNSHRTERPRSSQSSFHRLTACLLSSSDSQHQALNASAL